MWQPFFQVQYRLWILIIVLRFRYNIPSTCTNVSCVRICGSHVYCYTFSTSFMKISIVVGRYCTLLACPKHVFRITFFYPLGFKQWDIVRLRAEMMSVIKYIRRPWLNKTSNYYFLSMIIVLRSFFLGVCGAIYFVFFLVFRKMWSICLGLSLEVMLLLTQILKM